jgi:hypothetical protein
MRFDLAGEGRMLATREFGREVRHRVEELMATMEPGDTLIVECGQVFAMTVSFADECLGKLVADRASADGEAGLLIVAASEDLAETLSIVMERRKLAIANVGNDGRISLLGTTAPWLSETMSAAAELETFRVGELAEKIGATAPATNNRLRVLLQAGAVMRERSVPDHGGREFIYKVVAVPAAVA